MTSTRNRAALPLPRLAASELVAGPPDDGAGAWAGAPSALLAGDTVYLAYRLRRPIGEGRGYRNVIAVSTTGCGSRRSPGWIGTGSPPTRWNGPRSC